MVVVRVAVVDLVVVLVVDVVVIDRYVVLVEVRDEEMVESSGLRSSPFAIDPTAIPIMLISRMAMIRQSAKPFRLLMICPLVIRHNLSTSICKTNYHAFWLLFWLLIKFL